MITFEEAKELSKGYKVVPISMEIMSDIRTPMQVLRILKGVSSHCYMLESVNGIKRDILGKLVFGLMICI